MVPICLVNEETLAQVPEDVRQYLRVLRRHIIDLEQTDTQGRIAELEAANRNLQAQVNELLGLARQQRQQIQELRQQLADTRARLQTNSTNSSLPPSSDLFRGKRRPPRALGVAPPAQRPGQAAGSAAHRTDDGQAAPAAAR